MPPGGPSGPPATCAIAARAGRGLWDAPMVQTPDLRTRGWGAPGWAARALRPRVIRGRWGWGRLRPKNVAYRAKLYRNAGAATPTRLGPGP
jgi:hypothetical protein